ncbi:HAD-IC family P-type ATPase [Ruminococcaceae bacterium OttesenSCG-928-O06]|nr:HAD-IC family P-type ATPase [Ruminococcaceae bacterium OttesenSCG-928-O06]
MKKKTEDQIQPVRFDRVAADYRTGLTTEEVALRMRAGAHNAPPEGITPTVGKIVRSNVFTLFNLINFLLALAIVLVGRPRNALFFCIAVCNTVMGIAQELRAKRTLDKMSILARGTAQVVREGQIYKLPRQDVVLDDILLLQAGNQVCADAEVLVCEGLEVDESLLTGEADAIRKNPGQGMLSGSFVVAGQAWVRVTAVGAASYAGTLSVQAKQQKDVATPLMRTLNTIIKALAIAIIPLGLLLFYNQYTNNYDIEASVLGASAAMVGMIPEGLILLTSVTLTVGALKLARRKALVQSLPSIETLARVDVLCLDKTGTITDGTLSLEELVPFTGASSVQMQEVLREMTGALNDQNATAQALRTALGAQGTWRADGRVPFSSARKWSAVCFAGRGSYVLGAPGFVNPGGDVPFLDLVKSYAGRGYRVLCLAHTKGALPAEGLPSGLAPLGLVVLSDTIRPEAADTFRFFAEEGVCLKVISGDDALTVSTIAEKAGIANAGAFVDMSTVPPNADYGAIARRNTVFGRVSPQQKKQLVAAMKEDGHTVCMTGDGVNDVLAMKEANCGVAMIGGSEAARGVADFVLMTGDFSAMVDVLREGRRVINNIENVASLYLVKTIYSAILSLLYVFIPSPYPFTTLQMTPINSLTVGIPSFFLALRARYEKPEGRFLLNVLENSVPAAVVVVVNILVVQLAGIAFELPFIETSTMNVLLTGAVGFVLLTRVARPLKWPDITLISLLGTAFLCCFVLLGSFFDLGSLFTRNAFFYLPLLCIAPNLLDNLARIVRRAEGFVARHRKSEAA